MRISKTIVEKKISGDWHYAVPVVWDGDKTFAIKDEDGRIRVYDHTANYYSIHHPMTKSQRATVSRLIAAASKYRFGTDPGRRG